MRRLLPLVLLLCSAPAAQARLIVLTGGPTIVHAGEPADKSAVSVGYHYESFSLVWTDFWTWDGSYCLYGGRMDPVYLSDEQAARILGRPAEALRKPFAYRFPPGLLAIGGLLLLGILVRVSRRARRTASAPPASAAA